MNLKDITRFFRNRQSSVFIDLAVKYAEKLPHDKTQALLTLFLAAYTNVNRTLPPENDLEELELVLAGILPERNAQELLRRLEACQFAEEHGDEVCPANWKPGEETLKPSLDLVGLL